MKTLITWPRGSADGEREGQRMHATYPMNSNWIQGEHLSYARDTGIELLVVLGVAGSIIEKSMLDGLTEAIRRLKIPRVTLAECDAAASSGSAASHASEVLFPAGQHIADVTGAEVLTTTRALHPGEAGDLKAFAGSEHGFTPINPNGESVWKEFRRSDAVGEASGAPAEA
jgi:hypothetical protein